MNAYGFFVPERKEEQGRRFIIDLLFMLRNSAWILYDIFCLIFLKKVHLWVDNMIEALAALSYSLSNAFSLS